MYFCSTDCEYYVDFSDLLVSKNTHFCKECRNIIHANVQHYRVREWTINKGVFIEKGTQVVCEKCGDLAMSVLELGYCWSYGDLRDCIKEINRP